MEQFLLKIYCNDDYIKNNENDTKKKNHRYEKLCNTNINKFNYANKNIILFNLNLLLLIKYLFILIFQIVSSKEIQLRKLNNINSEIILTIDAKGNQKILSDYFDISYLDNNNNNTPYYIYVNDIIQNYTGKSVYNLKEERNIIRIKWNFQLLSCQSMFEGLSNINKIDLSEFDSSEVTDMSNMFKNCYYLSIIYLNNFNTSKVTDMNGMFYNCQYLI